jgi:hypothetical protein
MEFNYSIHAFKSWLDMCNIYAFILGASGIALRYSLSLQCHLAIFIYNVA